MQRLAPAAPGSLPVGFKGVRDIAAVDLWGLAEGSVEAQWQQEGFAKERGWPVEVENTIRMRFRLIPPGEFMMGSPESEPGRFSKEDPVHRVRLEYGFWLGRYPVTQGEWQQVMGYNDSHFKGDERLPVENVTWEECQDFVAWLNDLEGGGYRLASEAEWEYACRGGTETAFYGGPIRVPERPDPVLERLGWYCGNSGGTTHRVGEKAGNGWGLCDMHGNVWEWVEDDWHGSYWKAPADGSAWVDDPRGGGRCLRGGSWWNDARFCRSAARSDFATDDHTDMLGFRLARNLIDSA